MARFDLSFKLVNGDLVFDEAAKRFVLSSGDDAIPQTVDHFLKVQLGELTLHPNFGIDIFGIMSTDYAHLLMVEEIKSLKEKLGFETFSYSVSLDGREASIEASLRKE